MYKQTNCAWKIAFHSQWLAIPLTLLVIKTANTHTIKAQNETKIIGLHITNSEQEQKKKYRQKYIYIHCQR